MTILHIDLNSFFARVEQQANPHLRDKPIGVLGKGHKGARTCVCAASPEAKRFGVKSGMSVWEARRLCPSLILVPPNYPAYLDISRRFIAILETISPWIEIFSVDEAFLRLDGGVAKARATSLAIQTKLRLELGELITVSIGIAWGKTFAKLASDLEKPNGLVVLTPDTWLTRIGHQPVEALCGVGHRIAERLKRFRIQTINDLTHADASSLVAEFGPSYGMWLWGIGRGEDRSPLKTNQHEDAAKSMGHQVTLDRNQPVRTLPPILSKLTQKVGRRLRRAGQSATVISIHLSLADGRYWTMDHTFTQPASDDVSLNDTALRLLGQIPSDRLLVRRIGVTAWQLRSDSYQPLPLWHQPKRNRRLARATDQLKNRYGDPIIEWASSYGGTVGNLRDWRGPRAVLDQ